MRVAEAPGEAGRAPPERREKRARRLSSGEPGERVAGAGWTRRGDRGHLVNLAPDPSLSVAAPAVRLPALVPERGLVTMGRQTTLPRGGGDSAPARPGSVPPATDLPGRASGGLGRQPRRRKSPSGSYLETRNQSPLTLTGTDDPTRDDDEKPLLSTRR